MLANKSFIHQMRAALFRGGRAAWYKVAQKATNSVTETNLSAKHRNH
jgi:hypothetical protein